MTETLTIRRPDDWHVHLRDGAMLAGVVGYTARQFARAGQRALMARRLVEAKARELQGKA